MPESPAGACLQWHQVSRLPAAGAKAAVASHDVGNLTVIEFSGDYSRANTAARQQVAQLFYQRHPDRYDTLIVFSTFEFDTGGATAVYHPVRNDVVGIGIPSFDFSADFGSGGQLSGIVDMAALGRYALNPRDRAYTQTLGVLAHELQHRFGSKLRYQAADGALRSDLLGEAGVHWSYFLDSDASLMYGSDWEARSGGEFESVQVRHRFSLLDLYLAGLAAPSEVPPIRLIRGGAGTATDLPRLGARTAGTLETIDIAQVVAAEGPRQPATADAPRQFQAALLVLVRPGQVVPAEQLLQLEQLRIHIQQYYQAATLGRATLRVGNQALPQTAIAAPSYRLPLHPEAGSQPAAVPALVDRLRAMQQADGRFADLPATAIRDTALALLALEFWQPAHAGNQRARDWLALQQPAADDARRWQSFGLGARGSSLPDWAGQQADTGGFGLDAQWLPAVPDTLLAARALRRIGRDQQSARALQFLAERQGSDGNLAWHVGGPGQESLVAGFADELAQSALPERSLWIERSRSWLESRQRGDGGFGSPQSTLHDSVVVLASATRLGLSTSRRDQLRNYLLLRQSGVPGEAHSAAVLAMTLHALALEQGGNLSIEGPIDVQPAQPRAGQPVTLGVRVRNTGSTPVAASTLRWFLGQPGAGGIGFGGDVPVPALAAGALARIEQVWDSRGQVGEQALWVQLDAGGAVTESREDDNLGEVRVDVLPTPPGVELALVPGETTIVPARVEQVPATVQVRGQLHNLGAVAAPATRLELAIFSTAGLTPIASATVDVPAAGSTPFALSFVSAEAVPLDLRLRADPNDQWQELDEDNNQVPLRLEFGSTVDLGLSDADLAFSPAVPAAGEPAQLRISLHNHGTQDVQGARLRVQSVVGAVLETLLDTTVSLTGGSTAIRELPWRPSAAGETRLRVQLDPDNVIAELDESNNAVERVVQVQPATGINLYAVPGSAQLEPQVALEGQPLTVRLPVRNLGVDAAGAFTVSLYGGDPERGAALLASTPVTGLAASTEQLVELAVADLPLRGEVVLHVLVDASGQVPERNEGDNLLVHPTTVVPLADLALGSAALRLDPAQPIAGQPLTVHLRIENPGGQPAAPVQARLLLGLPDDGVEVPPVRELASLAAGAGADLSWSFTFPDPAPSSTLSAVVDPAGRVRETREDNNRTSLSFSSQQGEWFASPAWFSPNGDGVQDRTQLLFREAAGTSHEVRISDRAGRVVRTLSTPAAGVPLVVDWDGRDHRGRLLPDGRYSASAHAFDSPTSLPLGPVNIELDTNRARVDDAIGTPDLWQQVLRGEVPDGPLVEPSRLYSVGSSSLLSNVRVAPLLEYDVIGGGQPVPRISAPSWLALALANNLDQLELRQLRYARSGHQAWLAVDERGLAVPARTGLWVVSRLDAAAPRRIASLDERQQVLGELEDGRVIMGQPAQGKYHLVDPVSGVVTAYRPFDPPPNVSVQATGSGLLFMNLEPTLFVPADPALPVVPLTGDEMTGSQAGISLRSGSGLGGFNPSQTHLLRRRRDPLTGEGLIELVALDGGVRTELARSPMIRLQAPMVLPSFDEYSLDATWLDDHQLLVFDSRTLKAMRYGSDGRLRESHPLDGFRRVGPFSAPLSHGRRITEVYPGANGLLGAKQDEWDGSVQLAIGEIGFVCVTDVVGACIPFYVSGYEFGIALMEQYRLGTGAAPQLLSAAAMLPMVDPADQLRYPVSDYALPHRPYPPLIDPDLWAEGRHRRSGQTAQSTLANLTAVLRAQSLGRSIRLSGIITDAGLASWELSWRREGSQEPWRSIGGPRAEAVVDDVLLDWVPPGAGTWRIRLEARDLAGNRREVFAYADTTGAPPPIGAVTVSSRWLSPNGDGNAEALDVQLRVDAPVTAEVLVRSLDQGTVVRRYTPVYGAGDLGARTLAFDGRDDGGQLLPDGPYQVEVAPGFVLPLHIDTRAPTGHARWWRELPLSRVSCLHDVGPGVIVDADELSVRYRLDSMPVGGGSWEAVPPNPGCAQSVHAARALGHRWRAQFGDRAGNTSTLQLPPVEPALSLHSRDPGGLPVVLPGQPLQALFVDLSNGLSNLRLELAPQNQPALWRTHARLPGTRAELGLEVLERSVWLGHGMTAALDLSAEVPGSFLKVRGVGERGSQPELASNALTVQLGRFEPPTLEEPLLGRCSAGLAAPILPRPWREVRLAVTPAAGGPSRWIEASRFDPALQRWQFDAAVEPGQWQLQAALIDGDGVSRLTAIRSAGCASVSNRPERMELQAAAERQSEVCDAPADYRIRVRVTPDPSAPVGVVARRYQLQLANPLTQASESLLDVQVAANTALPDFEQLLNVNGWPVGRVQLQARIGDQVQLLHFDVFPGHVPAPYFQAPAAGSRQCGLEFPARLGDGGTLQPDLFALEWGAGTAPSQWIASTGPTAGPGQRIALTAAGRLPHGLTSVRLRAASPDGAIGCAVRVFDIDQRADAFRREPATTAVALTDRPLGLSSSGAIPYRTLSVPLTSLETVRWQATLAPAMPDNPLLPVGPAVSLGPEQPAEGDFRFGWDGRIGGTFIADGRYVLQVRATDDCGNVETYADAVVADSTPPVIELDSPAAGAVIDAPALELLGRINETHPDQRRIEIAAAATPEQWVALSGAGGPGVLVRWPRGSASGPHRLRLTATDVFGNQSVLLRDIVLGNPLELLDSATLTPSWISPNGDQVQDRATIAVTLRAPARLTAQLWRGASLLRTLDDGQTTRPAGGLSYVWDGRDGQGQLVSDGDVRLALRAEASGTPVESQELSLAVDTAPPALGAQVPADGNVRCTQVVSHTITDPHFLRYSGRLRAADGSILRELDSTAAGTMQFDTLAPFADPGGELSLAVLAEDLAGNRLQQVLPLQLDCTEPVATLETPAADAIVARRVDRPLAITGIVADARLSIWRLEWAGAVDAAVWTPIATGTAAVASAALSSWTVTAPDGPVWLRLVVSDRAGNVATTLRRIVVDGTPPEALLTEPADGAQVNGALPVRGTASDAHLSRYSIQLARTAAGPWTDVLSAEVAVTDAELGVVPVPGEGEYLLRLQVEDQAGFSTVTPARRLHIDAVAPSAPAELSASVEQNRDVRLGWSAVNATDLAGYRLLRDGQVIGPALHQQRSWLDRDAPEGTLRYHVLAVDTAGNASAASPEAIAVIDRTAPRVQLLAPAAAGRVRGEVVVIGSVVADDDLALYVLQFEPLQPPGPAVELRRSALPVVAGELGRFDSAIHGVETRGRLRLEAVDRLGNTAQASVEIVVDNQPPAAPAGLAATPLGADIRLDWNANSEADLLGYLLFRNGIPVNVGVPLPEDLRALALVANRYTDPAVPDGEQVWRLYAIDQAGNLSAPSNPATLLIERGPPHASFVLPVSGHAFEQSVELVARSTAEDIAAVEFAFRPADGSAGWSTIATVTAPPWRARWTPATGTPLGNYQLRALARDSGGRIDPAPALITVQLADLTRPAAPATLTAIADGAEVRLSWPAVTDADLAGYRLYRIGPDGSFAGLTPSPVSELSWVDAERTDGNWQYRVQSVDASGNASDFAEDTAQVFSVQVEVPFTPTADAHVELKGVAAVAGALELERSPAFDPPVSPGATSPEGEFLLPVVPLAVGNNVLELRVRSAAGDRSRSAVLHLDRASRPPAPAGLQAQLAGPQINLSWNPVALPELLGYMVQDRDEPLPAPAGLAEPATMSGTCCQPEAAYDGDPLTAWNGVGLAELEWRWSTPALVEAVELDWSDPALRAHTARLYGWSGHHWVLLLDVSALSEAPATLLRLPSLYRTDALRLRVTSPLELVQLAESRIRVQPLYATAAVSLPASDGLHRFQVRSFNWYGQASDWSQPLVELAVGDIEAPPAPALAGSVQGSTATLSWTGAAVPDLARWLLSRDGAVIATVNASEAPQYVDAGLRNGRYRYQLEAVDAVGNRSVPSNAVQLDIASAGPAVPRLDTVRPRNTGGALEIRWTAGSGGSAVVHFALERSAVGATGPFGSLVDVGAAETEYVDTEVPDGQTRWYRLRAVDALGNVSAWSNVLSATAGDTTAPVAPRLSLPTVAGLPLRWDVRQLPVCGRADAGSRVQVLHNGQPVGAALTALATDQRRILETGDSGPLQLTLLSPTGERYLAVFNAPDGQSRAELRSLAEPVPVSTQALDPVPQGARFGALGDRLWALHPQTGQLLEYPLSGSGNLLGQPLPGLDTLSAIEFFSFDAVGSTAVIAATRDGVRALWLFERDAGRLTALADLDPATLVGSQVQLSADAALLLLPGTDGRLRLRFLADGTSVALTDALDAGSGVAPRIAPDGRSVAWLQPGPAGGVELWSRRLDLPEAQRRWSFGGAPQALHWHDGDELGVLADGYWLRFSTAAAGEGFLGSSDLSLHFRTLEGFDVAAPGRLLVRLDAFQSDALTILDLAGAFCLRQVPTTVGRNTYSAVASDPGPGGATSVAAAPALIDVPGSGLPDLVVHPDDVRFSPAALVSGEALSAFVTVRNRGVAPALAAQLAARWFSPAGALQMRPVTLPNSIAAGGSATVAIDLGRPQQPGQWQLQLIADPLNAIVESDESNNSASAVLPVTSSPLPALELTVSATTLAPGGMLSGQARFVAPAAFQGRVRVQVRDAGGLLISTLLDASTGPVAAAQAWTSSFQWVPQLQAGENQIHGELLSLGGQVLDDRSVTVRILVQRQVQLSVLPDRTSYAAGSTAFLSMALHFQSGNAVLSQARLQLDARSSVTPAGSLFTFSRALGTLTPGARLEQTVPWPLSAVPAGGYTVELVLSGADGFRQTASASLLVVPAQPVSGVLGQIRPLPGAQLGSGQAAQFEWQLRNTGSAALEGVTARVRLLTSTALTEVAAQTLVLTIPAQQAQVQSLTVGAGQLALGEYLAVLDARLPGDPPDSWRRLAQSSLRMVDGSAPRITVERPLAGQFQPRPTPIRATIFDDASGVDRAELRIDGGAWSAVGLVGDGRYGRTEPALAEGAHTLELRAWDRQGNQAQTGVLSFQVDAQPPVIQIEGVSEGLQTRDPVVAQVTITDAHLADTSVLLDGQPYTSGTAIAVEGTHVLAVQAQDLAGNSAQRTVIFHIDRSPPALSYLSPAEGSQHATDTVPVTVQTEAAARVQLEVHGWSSETGADLSGLARFPAVPLLPGLNVLQARATDGAGNQGAVVQLNLMRLESAASWIGDLQAQSTEVPIGTPLQLAIRIENQSAQARTGSFVVQVLAPAGSAVHTTEFTESFAANAVAQRTLELQSTGLGLGSHALVLSLRDPAGPPQQLASSAVTLVDRQLPQLSLLSPGTLVAARMVVRAQATDALSSIATVRYRIDAGDWTVLPPDPAQADVYTQPDVALGEGVHQLEVEAVDAYGNRAAVESSVRSDQSPPLLTLAGVSDGQLSNQPLTPVFSATDPHPGTLTARLDGQLFQSGTEVGTDGVHQLDLSAIDAVGNASQRTVRFTIDRTPPVLNLQQPADGAILLIPSVTASGQTEAEATVLLLRGADQYTVVADAAGAFSVPAVSLQPGPNSLTVRATDRAGNVGLPRSVQVEYRPNAGVTLEATLLAPSPHPHGSPLPVQVQLRNNSAQAAQNLPLRLEARRLGQPALLDRHERTLSLAAAATAQVSHSFANTASWPWAQIELRLEAQYTLADGGLVWSPLATTVIQLRDTAAPVLSLLAPAAGSWHAQSVSVRASASDALSGLAQVQARLAEGGWVPLVLTGPDEYEAQLPTAAVDEGVVQLTLQATDRDGNTATAPPRALQIDRLPPSVQILDVIDGQVGRDPVLPRLLVTDTNAYTTEATLDGQPWTPGSAISAEGAHRLEVRATDPAGNRGEAQVHFTIDRTPPKLHVIHPLPGATLLTTQVQLIGNTEPGARLTASVLGIVQQTSADPQGQFAFQVQLARGPNTIVLTATDGVGNAAAPLSIAVVVVADPVIALAGSIEGAPATLAHGQPLDLLTRVRNIGNTHLVAQPLTLRVSTTGAPVRELAVQTWSVDLEVLASSQRAANFATAGWPATRIRLVLEAQLDGSGRGNASAGTGKPTVLAEHELLLEDRTAPVLSWQVPATAGQVLPPTSAIVVQAADPQSGLATVELRFDQTGPWLPMAPANVQLDRWVRALGDLTAGTHQVEVRAVDLAANATALPPRAFSLLRTLPLELLEPAPGALTHSPLLDLRARTEPLARVTLSRQSSAPTAGQTTGQGLGEVVADRDGLVLFPRIPLNFGTNRFQIQAHASDGAVSAALDWPIERQGLLEVPVGALDRDGRLLLLLLVALLGAASMLGLWRSKGGRA